MQKYLCPSCGGEIVFQSSISASCVCPYCRSLIVRQDMNLESLGKAAELPQDISPLQIGTTGIYRGVNFSIIGRLRVGWEEGAWNEWFLYTDKGEKAWLAEAQGDLAVIFEQEINEQALQAFAKAPLLGLGVTIGNDFYMVCDIKSSAVITAEGEFPKAISVGRKSKNIDLIGRDNKFAGLEYEDDKLVGIFTGEYVEFDSLKFKNLRDLDGWKIPRLAAKQENKAEKETPW
ncbi:MAG: DUF4178 domain-containing protein [Pseudomonadota bacterium]